MKSYALVATICCLATSLLAANQQEAAGTFRTIDLAPSSMDFAGQLADEITKAKGLKLTPFVQVSAEWCGPCRRLHASMDDPLMVDAFQGTYIIKLDADQWNETLKDTAYYPRGIPAFIAIDDQGLPVGKINGGAWGADIPENMAPPLKEFFNKHRWSYKTN